MRPHRRQHRPHHPPRWPAALCGAAIAGTVAFCLRPAPVHVVVPGANPCPMLVALIPPVLHDRMPPPGASPEVVEAVSRLNADLATMRAAIEEACRG